MEEKNIVCPKHRIVMQNGVCKMCQSEYYDKYYRKYSPKPVIENEKKKPVGEYEWVLCKQQIKPVITHKNDDITKADLERLKNHFTKK